MARPATPTNILDMRGSYVKNPQRRKDRANEPKPEKIGLPSRHLSAKEKRIWKEIINYMPDGVVGVTDTIALETLCKLTNMMRTDFESMTAAQLGKLETLLARFGMTPSDRTKIIVKKEENQVDPWADL